MAPFERIRRSNVFSSSDITIQPEIESASEISLPNGESFQQVTDRAIRAFELAVAENEDKNALMVTHDVVIRVLVAHVLGTSNSIYRRFEVANASLSIVRVADGTARLITLNDTSHLENQI